MSFRYLIPALLLLLALPSVSFGDESIVVRVEAVPSQAVFDDASRSEPIELSSAEAAAAYFSGEQLTALNESVDWDTHSVLIFAWRGSGGDRMEAQVDADSPDEVRFVYTGGRTRDLRPHIYVYVLEQGVVWEVASPDRKPRRDPGRDR